MKETWFEFDILYEIRSCQWLFLDGGKSDMVRGDLYSDFFFILLNYLDMWILKINLKNKKIILKYFKIKNTLKNNPYYTFKQTQNLFHVEKINLNWSNLFLNHLNKYNFDK